MNLTGAANFNINDMVQNFRITDEIGDIAAYGGGHINDTFLLKNKHQSGSDYLLQRVNHHVFKDVPALMDNILRVTTHLQNKLINGNGSTNNKILTLVPTNDGQLYHRNEKGDHWRVYVFIPDSRSYDLVLTPEQAFEGGKAFGAFQSLLADLDPGMLSETITNFHNIKKRLADLDDAINADTHKRLNTVRAEVEFVQEHTADMTLIYEWGAAGILPKRITHNDTKFNNVLLDHDDRALCVIDLDTVMPGYVAYDFGDAVRTIINTAAEDEAELSIIQLNTHLFKAFTQGFLQETYSFLTDKEIESLWMGVLLFPYMQGVRFLTDYLQGDTYYKIAYPEHNLVRTKAQFQLLKKILEQGDVLKQIITDTVTQIKHSHQQSESLKLNS